MLKKAFYSPTANAALTWVSIGALIFGGLAKLTPEWFGKLTWPQVILTGISIAIAVGLAVSICVFVFAISYRRFRPAPTEAKGFDFATTLVNPTTTAEVAEIRDELHTIRDKILPELEANVEGMARTLADLPGQMEQGLGRFDKRLAKLQAFQEGLVAQTRARIAPELQEEIGKFERVSHEAIRDEMVGSIVRGRQLRAHSERIHKMLAAVGVDETRLQEQLIAAQERAQTDTECAVILRGEEDKWQTAAEKREWHINDAPVAVYKSMLQGLAPAPSDIDLLTKLNAQEQ